ncbi:UNKNOWN [Stylonychia lemnae]|uniref:Uncharacterized protein n=1 Tax=Stylonychia lemnae TaxID=5949 RepID=A0A078B0G8_STYLE|nr:UNKNOWN [Stylonychia lemnae]|eukprot:CDW88150.1 UNKNOWN [Stylonychia lemnae]
MIQNQDKLAINLYAITFDPQDTECFNKLTEFFSFKTLRYIDSNFESKLENMRDEIRLQMVKEKKVQLIVVLNELYSVQQIQKIYSLFQYKDLQYIIAQRKSSKLLEVNFLENLHTQSQEEVAQNLMDQYSINSDLFQIINTNLDTQGDSFKFSADEIQLDEISFSQKLKLVERKHFQSLGQKYGSPPKKRLLARFSNKIILDHQLFDSSIELSSSQISELENLSEVSNSFHIDDTIWCIVDNNNLMLVDSSQANKLISVAQVLHPIKSIEFVKQDSVLIVFQNFGIITTFKLKEKQNKTIQSILCMSPKKSNKYLMTKPPKSLEQIEQFRVKEVFNCTSKLSEQEILIGTSKGLHIYRYDKKQMSPETFEMLRNQQVLQIVQSENLEYLIITRTSKGYQLNQVNIDRETTKIIYQFDCFTDTEFKALIPIKHGYLIQDSERVVLIDQNGSVVDVLVLREKENDRDTISSKMVEVFNMIDLRPEYLFVLNDSICEIVLV